MGKDKLSQKRNTTRMLIIEILLLVLGGVIFGGVITNEILVWPGLTIVAMIMIITGGLLQGRICYIKELDAIGKPTSIESIEIGKKYKVISIAISDEPFEEKERKVYLLLRKENSKDVFFCQRKKGEKPILLPETGDTIILIEDEFIIRKNQKE